MVLRPRFVRNFPLPSSPEHRWLIKTFFRCFQPARSEGLALLEVRPPNPLACRFCVARHHAPAIPAAGDLEYLTTSLRENKLKHCLSRWIVQGVNNPETLAASFAYGQCVFGL
jgi:hypothetical protein